MRQNIYDFNTVKDSVSCERYLRERDMIIRSGNRFNATWRGGDSFSCSFDGYKWFDHKDNRGGSVIDLCMKVEGLNSALIAVKTLGDRFRLPPVATTQEPKRATRGEMLMRDGYALTATYTYEDENGVPQYFVERYERTVGTQKSKEFVQRTTTHENIEGVKRLLYNLPAVIKSSSVYIVEGEKDVETMRHLGLVATTNSGGARYWDKSFNRYFADKQVIILPDNDEAGMEHGKLLYSMLKPIASSCRYAVVSSLPKGDVTDFLEKEGGDLIKLNDIVNNSGEPDMGQADPPEIAAAKIANSEPFKNFVTVQDGKRQRSVPRTIGSLIEEVGVRFLGFPKVLGSVMFDWSRDQKKIVEIYSKDDLFAWMQGCSGNLVEWQPGSGMVTKGELYSRIMQTATHYESASTVPFFPHRSDVFPMYDKLPSADPTHTRFWELVNFFNPATPAHRTLIAAFLCSPMYYEGGKDSPIGYQPRPAWIVDTDDAQGSGKSTVVNVCALLYNQIPFGANLSAIQRDISAFKKRLISPEGRQRRIIFFDNLTQTFKSPDLADMITAPAISERAAYGRGEESRPNDLTICATMNGASVDTDMATRCYTIRVKAVSVPDDTWLGRVQGFVATHRWQILADIIDMLSHAKGATADGRRVRQGSRFPRFDSIVLSAVCRTDEEFAAVDAAIRNEANDSNEDMDRAIQFEEAVINSIAKWDSNGTNGTGYNDRLPVYFRYCDLENILAHTDGALKYYKKRNIKVMVKSKKLPNWSIALERFPDGHSGVPRSHGIFFGLDRMDDDTDGTTRVQFVQYSDLRVPKVVATVRIKRSLLEEK